MTLFLLISLAMIGISFFTTFSVATGYRTLPDDDLEPNENTSSDEQELPVQSPLMTTA